MHYTIAMDGPAGAGKSTVASEVAKELGILHLDTGAMYRAFAYLALQRGIDITNETALEALSKECMPDVKYVEGAQQTWIDQNDVSSLIRTQEVSMATSTVSKCKAVREAMVKVQQSLAKTQSMLLDGRDVGTRILPDATIKIYLTASPEVRAQRRLDQLQQKGEEHTFEDVLADVIKRDEQDMNREVDPLRPAEDAQIIDTSEMTQAQVVSNIVMRVQYRMGKKPKREEPFSWIYAFVHALSQFVFSVLFPVRFHGDEEMQLDAPYMVIANHQSMIDPILVVMRCYRYHIRFLGKKELTKNKIVKAAFENVKMIPVDRHNMDMHAMRSCLKVISSGKCLGIFPEGTRHKEGVMQDVESGVAMIALRSKAKVLPVYITAVPKLFRPIDVYFGSPISVTHWAKQGINKDTCAQMIEHLQQTFAHMVKKHAENEQKAA